MEAPLRRVAALYDIHANLPALEAVLEELFAVGVDRIVVGGDVLPGPMPKETLALCRNLSLPVDFLYGNGEVAVLHSAAGKELAVPDAHRHVIRWCADQLDRRDRRFLASWPKTVLLQIQGIGSVLFCHATPRSENECFTRLTPEHRLLPVFEGLEVALVVCGHTHMQFDRMVFNVRVVNAGSVGMPFGKTGAHWIMLGPDIQFQHTSYDLMKAAQRVRDTRYPQAEAFAGENILSSPPEEGMLDRLTRAGI